MKSSFMTLAKYWDKPLVWVAMISLFVGSSPVSVAQEHPGCFMVNEKDELIDLSPICPLPRFPEPTEEEPVLGTGDVQVTLRWATIDDLDLGVTDPSGSTANYRNPRVASGGNLDVDANAGCREADATPVENVFWPTGGAPTGNYKIEVNLYDYCAGTQGDIPFTIRLLVKGQEKELNGKVSAANRRAFFEFSL